MLSNVIQISGYDEDERWLTVRFVSGLLYFYAGVSAGIATGFVLRRRRANISTNPSEIDLASPGPERDAWK
jgi:hypothetical protein